MANLKQARTPDEIKRLTVGKVKEEYNVLAADYNRLINLDYVYCPICGGWITSRNFYSSKKTASGINHTGCKKCLMEEATDYDRKSGTYTDNKEKAKNVLQKMDLPFIEALYDSALETVSMAINEKNRDTAWQQYIVMISSLPQYRGLSWNDSEFLDLDENPSSPNRKPRRDIRKIFGEGFSNEDYLYLQDQYDDWRSRVQVDSKSQETYIVRICFKLLDIYKAQRAHKDTDKLDKSLNELMASANLQPRQNVSNASTDNLTFGQLIERWENEEPIPKPDPEFEDVDGIRKYINVFFKGHLAKMMGLKNAYSAEYDEYMEQYTVRKPEYNEDEGSDAIYEKLFGKEVD